MKPIFAYGRVVITPSYLHVIIVGRVNVNDKTYGAAGIQYYTLTYNYVLYSHDFTSYAVYRNPSFVNARALKRGTAYKVFVDYQEYLVRLVYVV